MPEIDPVILQLKADNDRYLRELRRTTQTADRQLGQQERRVKSLETQFQRSSDRIGSTLKGLAGTFAAAFTGRELIGLTDSYTQLQNQLRVAGLEGENFIQVQERLFQLGERYGVSVNSLAELFGKAAQATTEFGASQEQNLALTEATSQALRITGTDAAQASGAILGLSQALASGVVRAEEFNQINEGGLRPLLQAAANAEEFGGSVAKLRNAMLEGEVTSEQFFRAILDNSAQLENQASKAVGTVSQAFTSLNNALIGYVGEAAKTSGATEALSEAIQSLADNLDTIIPALAIIAAALGTRYVVGAVAASGATRALVAHLAIAGTSLSGTALAARSAGAALLGAFGGPVGLAITAVGAGLIYVATQSESAEEKLRRFEDAADSAESRVEQLRSKLEAAGVAVGGLGAKADETSAKVGSLSSRMLQAADDAQKLIDKLREAGVFEAQARLREIERERKVITSKRQSLGDGLTQVDTGPSNFGGFSVRRADNRQEVTARSQLRELDREEKALKEELRLLRLSFENGVDLNGDNGGLGGDEPPPPPTGSGSGTTGGGSGTTNTQGELERSVERERQIARQVEEEITSYRSRIASAESAMATTAEREAELARRQVNLAERSALRSIEADAELNDLQRQRLAQSVQVLAETEREIVEFEKRRRLEQEAAQLADDRYQATQDALRLEYELADTERERRSIALRILDAENDYLRSKYAAVEASETATAIEKQRAARAAEQLAETADARREAVIRSNEGALDRYAREAQDVDARVERIAVEKIRDINNSIVDALSDELGVDDPFLKNLLSIFLDQNIFGPLAEALSNANGGGGGGILGGIVQGIGSLFGGGKAGGGSVSAGKAYVVGESGRELFMPGVSGSIVPNHKLSAGGMGGGGNATIRVELSGDLDARIVDRSTQVSVEVVKAASPQIIDASANETIRRAGRPSL